MEMSDYEQYYQKGGTYVLPIEFFNEIWGEMKNWEDTCKQKDNIIKEVREYIETKYDYLLGDDTFLDHDEIIDRKQIQHILEILDKGE